MTIVEICHLARRMFRELRDGLRRACRYLQSLGLPAWFAVETLLRAA